jgi:GT2 family glycosyltransferase
MASAVGIVICTRNRRAQLLATLDMLQHLPGAPPIVVVDNGSNDGSVRIVRDEHPHVRLIALDRNLGGGARNLGVRALDTPYVAFADDDSGWADDAFTRATQLLDAHPRLALLAACVLTGIEQRIDPVCLAMARSPLQQADDLPGPSVLGFLACGAIVRRDAFLSVGGFESRLGIGGEESLLAIDLSAAGWGLAYVPRVIAYHWPARVARDPARRRRVQARNRLWTHWLRRRPSQALAITRSAMRDAVHDETSRAALLDAVRGLPWVLQQRRRVPAAVERELSLLEWPD